MNTPPAVRLLLLVIICIVFGRVVFNDFVDWDDGGLIFQNDTMKPPLTVGKLAHQWNPSAEQNFHMYDPLVVTTWWLLAHVSQVNTPDIILGASLNPQIYHAANLLIHWLNACIVLEILRKLRFPLWSAAGGAAIFAIHPLQTESVAWATATKDLLSGFFALLTIWRYLIATTSTGKEFKTNYFLATLFFLLALLSKPSTVVLPLIAAAFDFFLYKKPWRRTALLMSPWLVLSFFFMMLTREVQKSDPLWPVPFSLRPLIAADALAFYLYKLILPINLSANYGRTPQEVIYDAVLHHPLYWTWIFPVAVALILWRSREPMLRTAGWVFLLGVLPVLGFLEFVFQYYSNVADRYVYVSMLGVSMVVAWLLTKYANRFVILAFSILLIVFGSLSFVQAGIWHDTRILYENTVSLNRTGWNQYWNLGNHYDRLGQAAEERAEADVQLNETALARQEKADSIANLRKAVENMEISIHYDDKRPKVYYVLIRELISLHEDEEAIKWMRQLIAIEPSLAPDLQTGLTPTRAGIAMAYYRLHRPTEAIEELRQNPDAVDFIRHSLKETPNPAVEQWLNDNFPIPQTQPATQTAP